MTVATEIQEAALGIRALEAALPPFSKPRGTSRQVDSIARAEQIARERLDRFDHHARKRLQVAYRKAGADIRRSLRAIMAKYPNGKWNYSDAVRFRDLARIFEEVRLRVGDLGFRSFRALDDDLADAFRYASGFSAYQLDTSTPPNIGVSFAAPPEPQVRAILDQSFEGARFSQKWGRVTNQMAQDIQTELMQSMVQGESIRDASRRINRVIGGSMSRSETIARTEFIRASTLGKDTVLNQNQDLLDPEHPKEWIITDDDLLCPTCEKIAGDDRYRLSDPQGMFHLPDGRVVPGPPAHPRCRCTPAPRTRSWSDLIDPSMKAPEGDIDERIIRNPDTGKNEIVDLPTYDAWAVDWAARRAA